MSQPHHYTVQVQYVDRAPETRRFEQKRVVIGRDGGDIVLRDTQTSAAHAEIEFDNGQIVVRDLGSTNGTWLGQRSLPQFALSPGQVFRCGGTQIRLLEISGGQPLVAGRTVMSDANALGGFLAGAPPSSGPATTPAARPPGPPPKPAGPSTGAIVGAALGGVLLLGAAATAGWFVFLREAPDTQIADADIEQAEPTPEPTPDPTPELDPALVPDPDEVLAPQDPDMGELYRRVGAATVVIRVPGSVGSGVVIDGSGIILTNHHVIDGGTHNGLSMEAKVVFGEYSDDIKTFEPRHEQVGATVMKVDEEHDLALIKLDEPPEGLEAVAIATENPYPGQRVAAIGHAGVGMLWAIKGGEISAAGSLAGHTELLLDANEGDREFLEERKKRFEKMGRVIQSTAKILPGDSGGPLVNVAGEIVGINAFGRIDQATNQWLSFHVHLAEVRAFVEQMPTRPLAMVPDPWDDAGPWSRVADANLDGRADVLLIDGGTDSGHSYSNWGALIDLDGDSFADGDASPEVVNKDIDALVEDEGFDAEFAVLREGSGASHYWYDTDGVDGFDLYILDEHGLGEPDEAWVLDELGGAEKIKAAIELDDGLRPELFTNADLALAFAQIGAVVFPGQVTATEGSDSLPPPVHQAESATVTFIDGNGDGLNDAVVETSSFDSRTFFDLDQNTIGRTTSAEALKVLLDVASVDSEIALIRQGPNAWVWYDTDNDGQFDLVLRTHDFDRGTADQAFTATPDGEGGTTEPVAAPEHIGRRLFRPGLLDDASLASRLAAHSSSGWDADASDDGMASFPSLTRSAYASVLVDDKVAIVTDEGHDLILVDVDGDSSAGGSVEIASHVRAGEYDAEFALLSRGGVEWAFYDRDNDGSFDWVAVSLGEDSTISHAFVVDGARCTADPSAEAGPLIAASRFSAAGIGAQFGPLAKGQWGDRAQ